MDDENKISAMRRKAGAGRPPPEIGRMNAQRVLRSAIAQGAEESVGVIAKVLRVEESRVTLQAFADDLPEHALLALSEGPDDRFGMVIVDAQCLAALIEMQTTGRIVPSPAQPRPPTRTDALLVADFIDRVLELFEEGVSEADLPLAPAVTGFRYALPVADVRAMLMTLAEQPYRLFDMQIDLGEGAKEGRMLILMPYDAVRPATGAGGTALWREALFEAVKCTHVELDAVLARKHIPLAEVSEFQEGTLITLPREVVGRVMIEDLNGAGVTLGRLGQSAGFRAICIATPCEAAEPEAAVADVPALAPGLPAPASAPDLPAPPDLPGMMPPSGAAAAADGAGDLPDLAGLGELPAGGAPPDSAGPGEPGGLGEVSGIGEVAGDAGDAGDAGATGQPDLPDLPDLPGMGELPDLADLPDLAGMGDLPDLETV